MNDSFTNQEQRIATTEDCLMPWSGGKNGVYFRCYLCGYKFVVGDKWRWVFGASRHLLNILVCDKCDGANVEVLDKWQLMCKKVKTKYWWFFSVK